MLHTGPPSHFRSHFIQLVDLLFSAPTNLSTHFSTPSEWLFSVLAENTCSLTRLEISNNYLDAGIVPSLIRLIQKNRTITALHMACVGLGNSTQVWQNSDFADALVANTSLLELNLSGNRIGDAGGCFFANVIARKISEQGRFTMTRLDLSANRLTAISRDALFDALNKIPCPVEWQRALKALVLKDNLFEEGEWTPAACESIGELYA